MPDPTHLHQIDARPARPTIWFEVDDFLQHFDYQPTPSGIQRVQMEILAEADAHRRARRDVRFCRLNRLTQQFQPVDFAMLAEAFHSSRKRYPAITWVLHQRQRFRHTRQHFYALVAERLCWSPARLSLAAAPFDLSSWPFKPEDVLICLGMAWANKRYGDFVQLAKQRFGIRFAVVIHDLIPVTHPQFMLSSVVVQFRHWIRAILGTSDLVLTNSRHTRSTVLAYAAEQRMTPPATKVLPLGTGFRVLPPATARGSVTALLPSRYVLFVSTIEIRKNHRLLMRVWQRLITKHGASHVPKLVFVGGSGWLVNDLLAALAASRHLDGKILVLSDLSDAEVKAVYKHCLFTVYPSLAEGWGLPVAESLENGKLCVASNRASIPEVGGDLVDYLDPDNEDGSMAAIERVIFDGAYRRAREERIRAEYHPPSWADCAATLIAELDRLGTAGETTGATLDALQSMPLPLRKPSSPR